MLELAAKFTCAADEVWRLQRGSDEDCVLFQRWVNGGERITDRGSRQGLWVFAAGGRLLGAGNTRSIDAVVALLEDALDAYAELDETQRRIPAGIELDAAHRWEHGYPEGGLALLRLSRDLAREGLAAPPSSRWNRDTFWCSADEVRAMLPEDLGLGATFELPLIATRLARFCLVDDVRGQTLPYAPAEIGEARLVATVTHRNADGVHFALRGHTRATAGELWQLGENLWTPKRGSPHTMECEIIGMAVFNGERFTAFDLVAVGKRTGRTQFNGRAKDPGPSLIGFRLELAPPNLHLAPAFAALYEVAWIPRPELATWRLSPAECGLEEK